MTALRAANACLLLDRQDTGSGDVKQCAIKSAPGNGFGLALPYGRLPIEGDVLVAAFGDQQD
jgi:hypothetical protein